MIKLIALDWNGTLLSDTAACVEADNVLLKSLGGRPVGINLHRDTIVIPANDFYAMHGIPRDVLEKNVDVISRTFHEHYERRAARCRTRAGVRELLAWLKCRGIASVIISNHTVAGIESQLERLKIKEYFAAVLANEHLTTSMMERNKLMKLQRYLQEKGCNADEAIIVGDSPEEVEIGKALRIATVAITGGSYSTQRLRKAGPDYLISKLGQLRKIVDDIQ